MKYSLIFSFFLGALVISGCRKDDNPKSAGLSKSSCASNHTCRGVW